MKRLFVLLFATSLIAISGFNSLAYDNVNGVYNGNIVPYDVDEGSTWQDVAVLSHNETQNLINNWDASNVVLQEIALRYPSFSPAYFLSVVSQYTVQNADKGNGVIIQQLVPPANCTFCGSGYTVVSR